MVQASSISPRMRMIARRSSRSAKPLSAFAMCRNRWFDRRKSPATSGSSSSIDPRPASRARPVRSARTRSPADWFGGNIKLTALRVLARCIVRQSKNDELDVWEFKEGYEAHVREWIKRLRDGYLVLPASREADRSPQEDSGRRTQGAQVSGSQRRTRSRRSKRARRTESLQSKLNELGSKALELQKMAAEELKKNRRRSARFSREQADHPCRQLPDSGRDRRASHSGRRESARPGAHQAVRHETRPLDRLQGSPQDVQQRRGTAQSPRKRQPKRSADISRRLVHVPTRSSYLRVEGAATGFSFCAHSRKLPKVVKSDTCANNSI